MIELADRRWLRVRALFALLWSVRFRRPRVEVAELLGLSAAAVSMMLVKLQSKGVTAKERKQVERVWKQLTTAADIDGLNARPEQPKNLGLKPKFLVMKRQRKRIKA